MVNRSFFNKGFLPVMKKTIKKIRAGFKKGDEKIFQTVVLIEKYIGHYTPDNTPPHDSLNANIGKFLKENDKALGIHEIEAKKSITISGKKTTTSVWKIIDKPSKRKVSSTKIR